jgi:2-oxoisovalerate dehydrogenase E2 component (dihydrolipoyl transacylase)
MPAFLLPDLGEGLTEAEIVAWRVQAGDSVAIDQAVVEVETAKAVVEVPVPFAGRVTALHGQPGDVLSVGSPLLTVDEDDTDRGAAVPPADPATGHAAAPLAEPGVATPLAAPDDDGESGSVLIGYGTSASRRRRRVRRSPALAASPAAELTGTGDGAARPPAAAGAVAIVSPVVRRLARAAGLDVAAIRGSGRDGLITRRDVDAAIEARSAEAPPAEAPPAEAPPAGKRPGSPPAAPAVPAPGSAQTARIPIRGSRKAVADKLSRSRREIPEATVWVDADATELVRLRATLNADESAPKISLMAMLSRYAILGLRRYPELNARIEGDEIVIGAPVHLGFAAQTSRGLVVPVVRDAQLHTLEQLSATLAERTQRARESRLAAADLTGGTFTINNYGVFGVDGSAAIINHPEVAILGIGRIIERPWVVDGQIAARHVTELTLAFDHRACDGGTAGGFLRFVADCVESPMRALRDM